jgi:hypothetical protein
VHLVGYLHLHISEFQVRIFFLSFRHRISKKNNDINTILYVVFRKLRGLVVSRSTISLGFPGLRLAVSYAVAVVSVFHVSHSPGLVCGDAWLSSHSDCLAFGVTACYVFFDAIISGSIYF